MGSMKQKRRKQALKEWTAFQGEHELSDEDVKLARQTGFTLERLRQMLLSGGLDEARSVPDRIREIHRVKQENNVARKAAIDAGLIEPKKKAPKKKAKKEPNHDPHWAKAKQVCRLNMDDIRKAKELGLSPRALIKNVPGPSQQWKAPVKVWIQELYEKRIRARGVRSGKNAETNDDKRTKAPEHSSGSNHQSDHDSVIHDWELNAQLKDDWNYEFL